MEVYGIDKANFSTWFKNRRLAPKAKKGKIPSDVVAAAAETVKRERDGGSRQLKGGPRLVTQENSVGEASLEGVAEEATGDSLQSQARPLPCGNRRYRDHVC